MSSQASNVDQVRQLRSQRGSLDADVHMLLNEAELEEYLSKSLKAAAHRYIQFLHCSDSCNCLTECSPTEQSVA